MTKLTMDQYLRRVYWRPYTNEDGESGWICCNDEPERATRIDVAVGGGPYVGSYTWEFHDIETLYHVERLERMLRKAFGFGHAVAKAEVREVLGCS